MIVIPQDGNYIQFYYKCKEKGIKVRSRYKGVYVSSNNNNVCIVWGIRIGSKSVGGTFPFDKHGELAAHKKRLSLLNSQTEIK